MPTLGQINMFNPSSWLNYNDNTGPNTTNNKYDFGILMGIIFIILTFMVPGLCLHIVETQTIDSVTIGWGTVTLFLMISMKEMWDYHVNPTCRE
jgi:hypothetical protein